MTDWIVRASKRCDSIDELKSIDAEFKKVTGFSPTETGAGFAMRDVGCVVNGAKAAAETANKLRAAGFNEIHVNILDL